MNEDDYREADSAREGQHQAVISDWRRKQSTNRELDEAAQKGLKLALKEGLGKIGDTTRGNIAKDLINASKRETPEQYKTNSSSGYLAKARELDNDLITGYEPLPWDRDK